MDGYSWIGRLRRVETPFVIAFVTWILHWYHPRSHRVHTSSNLLFWVLTFCVAYIPLSRFLHAVDRKLPNRVVRTDRPWHFLHSWRNFRCSLSVVHLLSNWTPTARAPASIILYDKINREYE